MKKSLKNTLFYLIFIAIIIVVVVFIVKSSAPKTITLNNYSDLVRLIDNPDDYVRSYLKDKKGDSVTPVKPEETLPDAEPEESGAAETTASPADPGAYTISKITIGNNNVITVVCKGQDDAGKSDTKTFTYKFANESILYNDLGEDFLTLIREDGSSIKVQYQPVSSSAVWLQYLPYLIIVVVFIIIYIVAMRKALNGGGEGARMNNFGKAKVKTAQASKDRVTFADVAGADEEKEELQEVVDFLRDPTKFTQLGARIPRGVLLVGPPGTGKTLLAKAVAGEAGVPFLSISGSDFVEMYVGVGASRVRDLFETARKAPASIIFIDEIDAVGRHRGAGLGGGHDEREQTLNQLLVEMDGFGTHDGVIVIAATNRPDILDPALLRPGRFDRQITVNVPDIKGREEILKVHARKKPLEPDVDLKEVAKTTAGFTGADLANLLNEAALLAARRGKTLIGMDDISDAFIKVIAGPKKRSMHIKEDDKRKTAYHEAGHAMIAYLLNLDPVQQISIIPSGNALGYTLNPPADDKYSVYKNELKAQISMLLAGRAAEQIVCGDISGGASNDIQRATKIAKRMVTQLGMSDVLGPRCFGNGQEEIFLGREISSSPDYSDDTAAKIDAEIHQIISEAYNKAVNLLTENIEKLHFLAGCLVRFEIIDGDQFRAAMEKENVTEDDILAISEEKKAKSEEANRKRAEQKKEVKDENAPKPTASDYYSSGNGDPTAAPDDLDYESDTDEEQKPDGEENKPDDEDNK